MLIDIHTHVFPNKIAARAISVLQREMNEINNDNYPVYSDGTLSGLKHLIKEYGISQSVVMPIATRPEQTENIIEFADMINKSAAEELKKSASAAIVTSFGTVHPDQPDLENVLERLADRGFKGIKIHPEFQKFDINGTQGMKIIKKAQKLGLIIMIHSGVDLGFKCPVHCSPKMLSDVITEVDGSKIIAAHLGGFQMWDEVEKHLVGKNILMDTAYLKPFIDHDQYKRIVLNHGADKILFGSDLPWEHPQETLSTLCNLELDYESMEKILYKNAQKLLTEKK